MSSLPIPVGTIVKATITWLYGEVECQHKFHFKTEVLFSDMLAICTLVMNDLAIDKLNTIMVSASQLINVTCAEVSAELFTSQTLFPSTAQYGALPELGVAPIVCNVWQLRTGFSGRRGRGRVLIFGFPNAYVENYHKLNDFAHNQMRALANLFERDYSTLHTPPYLTMGVFSQKAFHATGDETTSFAPLEFINIQSRLSSCSKRRS